MCLEWIYEHLYPRKKKEQKNYDEGLSDSNVEIGKEILNHLKIFFLQWIIHFKVIFSFYFFFYKICRDNWISANCYVTYIQDII